MGSPTEPSTRSEVRSWRPGYSVPHFMKVRMAVGARVEDGHPVALDDRPPAVPVGKVRCALVHHRGGPVGQRAVDDVAVAGDPADVGGAPVDVALGVEVEDRPVGEGHLGQVAPGGVHDALGRRRGARGVQDEQQVLGVHVLGRARRPADAPRRPGPRPLISSCHQWSRPAVMPRDRRPVVEADAAGHHHVLDARRLGHRRVHVGLQARPPPPAATRRRRSPPPGPRRRGSGPGGRRTRSPPNTTEWTAPMRVQASMATASSGIIGM